MLSTVKKVTLLLLMLSLVTHTYAASGLAGDLMPEDCMMSMVDSDIPMESNCDCDMEQMQCQRCSIDINTTHCINVSPASNDAADLDTFTYLKRNLSLDSVTLTSPSPPPIS